MADISSPVFKHAPLMTTEIRARQVPLWIFHHENYLENILVFVLFSSWLVTLFNFKGIIIRWVALKEFTTCIASMVSLGVGARNLGT